MGKERCERAVIKVVAINNAANNTFSYLHKASRGSRRKLLRFEGLCPGGVLMAPGPRCETAYGTHQLHWRWLLFGQMFQEARLGSTFQKYFQVSIHTYGRHRWFKGLFWISLFVGPTPQPASVDVLWLYCTGARKGVVPFMDAWKRARHCLLWWECHSDEPALELYPAGQIPSRKNNHGP